MLEYFHVSFHTLCKLWFLFSTLVEIKFYLYPEKEEKKNNDTTHKAVCLEGIEFPRAHGNMGSIGKTLSIKEVVCGGYNAEMWVEP